MQTVLLVDDDLPMLSRLKSMMDWEAHGYDLLGEASSGKSAQRILSRRQPDIVITDMSMPGMDGLELIAYLQSLHAGTKIIAISSYSDVHYIRNSMKNGAIDYILKHELNADVLLQTLRTASRQLAEERLEQEKSRDMQQQLTLSQSFLRENAIRRLVQSPAGDDEATPELLARLGIVLNSYNHTAVAVEWDQFARLKDRMSRVELEKLTQSFMDIAGHIAADVEHAYAARMEESKFVLLFSLSTSSRLLWHTVIHETLGRIRVTVKRQLNLSVSFSVSSLCIRLKDLPAVYQEADQALQARFYEGNDIIIWPDTPKKESPLSSIPVSVDIKLERALLLHLSKLEGKEALELLAGLFERMIETRAASKSAQMACVELLHLANKVMKENGIADHLVFEDDEQPYKSILGFDTIQSLQDWVLQIYRRLLAALRSYRFEGNYSEPVRRALEWIRGRFSKPITLQQVADEIGVNPSYLSRLFKEEVHQGFADYLNRYRVEQAKRLIREGASDLKEVVRLTGFSSYNYFFTVFKKVTGLTPLEFEKQRPAESDVKKLV